MAIFQQFFKVKQTKNWLVVAESVVFLSSKSKNRNTNKIITTNFILFQAYLFFIFGSSVTLLKAS